MKIYYSHGKLLLTGEYLVLDEAQALAVPTKRGQHLEVTEVKSSKIQWTSKTEKDQIWFSAEFSLHNLEPLEVSETPEQKKIAQTLSKILQTARQLNPNFLKKSEGVVVTTLLEFPSNWGLGSSSTLINNIAQWAEVNPFKLLELSFGGSGYDIAVASSKQPVLYQRTASQPKVKSISFHPNFSDHIYFVHLNQKKDSKEAIQHYRSLPKTELTSSISKINQFTKDLLEAKNIESFEKILNNHELLLSTILKTSTIKSEFFKEYPHTVKSLGGWGGDFVMVTTRTDNDLDYFKRKGYQTIIPYVEMVL
ncbi:GYDIA family GHMP kinase [Aquimarina sp. ERC-38]|uniref:GYDIA family GHMP kinase n=1 Tax=Aquimarina sp. ERC-38 TaxID=2949996 RepID=UPI0022473D0A|nr:GYDIA family GHMP kinase [Aquimarina sp. ERC-38]UZO81295.1 GYDIA family GHMP kinase [Aquimarina sp. ERC-38]